jgi:two-component system, chemotaxis family, chemotaxis protein CheY
MGSAGRSPCGQENASGGADCSSSYVCIVDDDDDIRMLLRFALEMSGYRVAEASDGFEALELLRRGRDRCELVLLDLMMPGMNGWEFRALQRQDPALAQIPVVVVSGVRDFAAAREIEANAYMSKPIDFERLIEVVRTYVRPANVVS